MPSKAGVLNGLCQNLYGSQQAKASLHKLCRKTKTDKALGHKAKPAVREKETKATCTEKGKYDEVVYCSVCYKEISRKTKTEKALGHTTSNGKCSRCGTTVTQVTKSSSSSGGGSGSKSVTVPKSGDTQGHLVWIPTNGGKKYHSKSSCSNMKDPMQVTEEHAIENGFEPCKKCYK